MLFRKLAYNSVSISAPKNAIQYAFGALLFYLTFGFMDAPRSLLGLAGFLLAYSSVYLYNDIIDADEDSRNEKKKRWKLVASGELSIGMAKLIGAVMLISGLALSLAVGPAFLGIIALVLLLNFLHSSPYTRFKKSRGKTVFNMSAIEFLKFSAGWFAVGQIEGFPFWIFLLFSLSYVVGYMLYKFDLGREHVKQNRLLFYSLGAACAVSYLMSFALYRLQLAMLLSIALPAAALSVMKLTGWSRRMRSMIAMEYIILAVVMASFILMLNPVFSEANRQLVAALYSILSF